MYGTGLSLNTYLCLDVNYIWFASNCALMIIMHALQIEIIFTTE
jgi:hypothetical protein